MASVCFFSSLVRCIRHSRNDLGRSLVIRIVGLRISGKSKPLVSGLNHLERLLFGALSNKPSFLMGNPEEGQFMNKKTPRTEPTSMYNPVSKFKTKSREPVV